VAASAALGIGGRALAERSRRPRVLGVQIPRELTPSHLASKVDPKRLASKVDPKRVASKVDPKRLAGSVDLKKVAKHIGNAAEQIEERSEDVRVLSGQAKRLSRKLT
jgi:hypothetical protein